jgi:hypothetical protein
MRMKLSSSKLGIITLIAATGALLGIQLFSPTKRVIETIGGLVLVYLIWNFSTLNALWLIFIIYPFPFAISVGHSTFVFIVIVFIIHLIRVSSHKSTMHFDRRFNLPILLMVLSYLLSFYNIDRSAAVLRIGLIYTVNFFAAILAFYMIVNFVNDDRKLYATVRISMITCALIILFNLFEVLFPGKVLIPGWLYTAERELQLVMKDVRMKGAFHDYELNAEFYAMNVSIILLMAIRARRLLTRTVYVLLLIVDVVMLFTTITRGAFISLTIGLIYLAFLSRRDLSFTRLVAIAGAFIGLVLIIDTVVAQYTVSGSLLGRMAGTTIEKGFIPDTRVEAWGGALRRGLQHPFLGHGPGWSFSKGLTTQFWPHNIYLFYFNITGLFGLSTFIFLLVRLVQTSALGLRSSLVRDSFPEALLKVLHVSLVIFIIDQAKVDYLRSTIYIYFVWFFFGMIVATRNIIRSAHGSRAGT